MLSFGAPGFLVAAGAAAAGVVLLHLLARAHRPAPLPTARFLPDPPESAIARARRPADLALLLLRVLALLLIGAGFARPAWTPARAGTHRVVLLDLSRAVADPAAARAAAAQWLREGDTLIAFDSAVHLPAARTADSVAKLAAGAPPMRARGSLAAALLAGQRAARERARRADSVELVLVSPLAAEEWDAVLPAVRALWPGALRLVPTAATPPPPAARAEIRASGDDPLRATFTLALAHVHSAEASREPDGPGEPGAPMVRLQRGEPSAEDLAWARAADRALVHWPATEVAATAATDSIGAVVAGGVVVVAPFARGRAPAPGEVVARWADGRPAATERALGAGCVRDVPVALPGEGDLVLRESAQRLLRRLMEPCGGLRRYEPLDSAGVALLAGSGSSAVALASAGSGLGRGIGEGIGIGEGEGEGEGDEGVAALCLGAAILLLIGEMLLRRRGGEA